MAIAIVALLLINFIKPWYSSDAATDLLGAIFEVRNPQCAMRCVLTEEQC